MKSLRSPLSVFALGCTLFVAACSSLPKDAPPLAVFRHRADAEHFFGTGLSGPEPGARDGADYALEETWSVEVAWRSLRQIPETDTEPLGSHTRAVLSGAPDAGEPIMPGELSELLLRARITYTADLEALQQQLITVAGAAPVPPRLVRGALVPGSTASFEVSWDTGERWGVPSSEQLRVLISRPEDPASNEAEIAIRAEAAHRCELVVLDAHAEVDGAWCVLIFPVPLGFEAGAGIAAEIRVTRASENATIAGSQHVQTYGEALADYQRARAARDYWRQALRTEEALPRHRDVGVGMSSSSLSNADSTFLFARTLGCEFAAELVMALEDEGREQLRETFRKKLLSLTAETDRQGLSFALQHAAIEFLLDLNLKGQLTRAQKGIAVQHLGALAYQLPAMEDMLHECSNTKEIRQFILESNRDGLEDSSLEMRVVALDFLKRAQAAPALFDPMASSEARRQQLDAARREGWK